MSKDQASSDQSTDERIRKGVEELKTKLPGELHPFLEMRDGPAVLLKRLPQIYEPRAISEEGDSQRAWELTALHYMGQGRFHEALRILDALYSHMIAYQIQSGQRCHKAVPLVWMSECFSALGYPVHAKRYLMLTLVEDAIVTEGKVSPEASGIYFRLVWGRGLADSDFHGYAQRIMELALSSPTESMFPEWVLLELNQDWMIELPSASESSMFLLNHAFAKSLIDRLGDQTGDALERLAQYILSCMAGCRTYRRQRSRSTDYDIICSMDGFDVDFRSEFGRYFVCECKDWQNPADFTTMAKFCRVLDSTKCRFGIIFSRYGISGQERSKDAEREQLKVFQDRGMVIVVVNETDLRAVADRANLIQLLRTKYEKVRLDLV